MKSITVPYPQHSCFKHFAVLPLFLEERWKSETTWPPQPKRLFLSSNYCRAYSYNLSSPSPFIINIAVSFCSWSMFPMSSSPEFQTPSSSLLALLSFLRSQLSCSGSLSQKFPSRVTFHLSLWHKLWIPCSQLYLPLR